MSWLDVNGSGWFNSGGGSGWNKEREPLKPWQKKMIAWGIGTAAPLAAGYIFWDQIKAPITYTGIGISAIALGYVGLKMWQTTTKEELTSLKLTPKKGLRVDPKRVAMMVKEFRQTHDPFFRKRNWFRWQIIRDSKERFEFRLIFPRKHAAVVKTRLGNAYPDAILTEESVQLPEFYDPTVGEAAHLKLKHHKKERGLNPYLENHMGDILSLMERESILEITFSPTSIAPIRRRVKGVIKKLEDDPDTNKKELIKRIKTRYEGDQTAFDVYINAWGKYGIGAMIGELSAKTEFLNKFNGRPYRLLQQQQNAINWDNRLRTLAKWRQSTLTDRELAPLFMLPHESHPVWHHIPTEFPRPTVTEVDFKGKYGIGKIDSDNPKIKGKIARLREDTLTNHMLIAGGSGGGKGSSLMSLIKTDFLRLWIEDKNSMGMTLCDPHTDDILLILARLLDMEEQGVEIPWERVKVVSFGTRGSEHYPVAANLLHIPSDATIDRVATDCAEVILSAFDSTKLSESAAFLSRAIQALAYSKRKVSILDICRMFQYDHEGSRLRKEAIAATAGKNDVISDWWTKVDKEIDETERDKKVSAIDTRLAPLIAKKSMQRFFCREDNFFSRIPEFLEDGDLVLIDFMGADDEMFRLCASWLANLYFNASQARGTGKRPHLLVFDEVQKFSATDSFFKILTENRKFELGLLLLTQEVEALDPKLKGAIKTNAGAVMSVWQQDKGAKAMADLLGDPFTAEELESLKKGREAAIRAFDGKARLHIDYPSYVWQGQETERKSEEEQLAKERAEAKFFELLKQDHKTAAQADLEIRRFVYGTDLEQEQPTAKAVAVNENEAAATSEAEEQNQTVRRRGIRRVK